MTVLPFLLTQISFLIFVLNVYDAAASNIARFSTIPCPTAIRISIAQGFSLVYGRIKIKSILHPTIYII